MLINPSLGNRLGVSKGFKNKGSLHNYLLTGIFVAAIGLVMGTNPIEADARIPMDKTPDDLVGKFFDEGTTDTHRQPGENAAWLPRYIAEAVGKSEQKLTFGDLEKVKSIDLTKDTFSNPSFIPNHIMYLENLEVLKLNKSHYNLYLPNDFRRLTKLTHLELSAYTAVKYESSYSYLNDVFMDMTNLKTLILKNTGYTGSLPTSFRELTSLETFTVDNRDMDATKMELNNSAILGTKFKNLHLNNVNIDNSSLQQLLANPKLENIYIRDIRTPGNANNTAPLNWNNNNKYPVLKNIHLERFIETIEDVPSSLFTSTPSLETISLANNTFKGDVKVYNLPNLTQVRVAAGAYQSSLFPTLTFEVNPSFYTMKKLTDISLTTIGVINMPVTTKSTQLISLYLAGVKMDNIPTNIQSWKTNMENLTLTNIPTTKAVTKLPLDTNFKDFKKLKVLALNRNIKLHFTRDNLIDIVNLPVISNINLSGTNVITEMPKDIVTKLLAKPDFIKLDLGNTGIYGELPDGAEKLNKSGQVVGKTGTSFEFSTNYLVGNYPTLVKGSTFLAKTFVTQGSSRPTEKNKIPNYILTEKPIYTVSDLMTVGTTPDSGRIDDSFPLPLTITADTGEVLFDGIATKTTTFKLPQPYTQESYTITLNLVGKKFADKYPELKRDYTVKVSYIKAPGPVGVGFDSKVVTMPTLDLNKQLKGRVSATAQLPAINVTDNNDYGNKFDVKLSISPFKSAKNTVSDWNTTLTNTTAISETTTGNNISSVKGVANKLKITATPANIYKVVNTKGKMNHTLPAAKQVLSFDISSKELFLGQKYSSTATITIAPSL